MIDIQWVDHNGILSYTNGEHEDTNPLTIESLEVASLLQPEEGEALPSAVAGPLWLVLPDGRWLNTAHIRTMRNTR